MLQIDNNNNNKDGLFKIFKIVASASMQIFSLQCYPHKGLGGGHYQKFFCKDVWSEPGNLYHISDQRLRVFILLFRPEPKISTPFQISKISTRLLYVSAVNWNWVAFAWTFERGYKFTDVDAEKIVPCRENKLPNPKPEGKAYSFSDQNGDILCAFSDRENNIRNHAQARGKSIPYIRQKWWKSMRFFRPQ